MSCRPDPAADRYANRQALAAEMETLPAYRGWTFSYEYPGFFCYSHETLDRYVAFTPDWEGTETLPIEVHDADGNYFEDLGASLPLPYAGRTAQRIFEMVRPTLDQLLGGAS